MKNSLANAEWQLVGKVKAAHGLKGEVYIFLFAKEASWLNKVNEFLVRNDVNEKIIKIQTSKEYKDGLIAKLEGISDRNQSEALKGSLILIPSSLFTSKKNERIFLSEIIGFNVLNYEKSVGVIQSISSNGAQDLLAVEFNNKLFEVPFVEAFIVKIDFNLKKVFMEFPEDLIGINQ